MTEAEKAQERQEGVIDALKSAFRKIGGYANDNATREYLTGNETATRQTLVNPFLEALGYDARDPRIVRPELTADVGTKAGEKVDYGIYNEAGELIMLVEVKSMGTELTDKHLNQLRRYYQSTDARIGVLTNGLQYAFYLDTDAQNVMDDAPYMTVNVLAPQDSNLKELAGYRLCAIDDTLDTIAHDARRLKDTARIKQVLRESIKNPSDEMVTCFARALGTQKVTQKRLGYVREMLISAQDAFYTEEVSRRLRDAIERNKEL